MRLKHEIAEIDYTKTKKFFSNRAGKYNTENPYSVTMYQDDRKELVQKRNKAEIEKIYPLLGVDENSRILDLACGIGRWADAIDREIAEYCGVDFSEELIEIARKRNEKKFASFYSGATNKIRSILERGEKGTFNIILMVGILLYLNDQDISSTFDQVKDICEKHAVICIREPIGIEERLTLKDFYSKELKDHYNAIYRTRTEIMSLLQVFFENGFEMKKEGFLFEGDLNNRKETAQYFFLLER